eukprot:CCRYP_012433-RE/>CCRYP_012433-RE protein AED:0.48 eAED:0.79 QI:0/0/0/1/0/0/3/0/174
MVRIVDSGMDFAVGLPGEQRKSNFVLGVTAFSTSGIRTSKSGTLYIPYVGGVTMMASPPPVVAPGVQKIRIIDSLVRTYADEYIFFSQRSAIALLIPILAKQLFDPQLVRTRVPLQFHAVVGRVERVRREAGGTVGVFIGIEEDSGRVVVAGAAVGMEAEYVGTGQFGGDPHRG